MRTLAAALFVVTPAFAQEWVPLSLDHLRDVAGGVEVAPVPDDAYLFRGGDDASRYELSFTTELEGITALRIEVLPHESLPAQGPGRAHNGNFVLSELGVKSRVGRTPRRVDLARATASFSQPGWNVRGAIDGDDATGWAILGATGKASEAVFNFAKPLGKGRRTLELELSFLYGSNHSIGSLRVSATTATGTVAAAGQREAQSKFELAINGAIDKGVDYLVGQQDLDGSWPGDRNHYRVGGTALNAYALVKSGVRPQHMSVRRALAYIDAHPPEKTYEAGCVLMLYSALDHRRHRERAQEILANLVEWQTGDWGYPGSHGDPGAAHTDLSNTQYGALGYRAADAMGIEVPGDAWRRLVKTTLQYQRPDGGFGYTPGAESKGSMTAAGTAILALSLPHIPAGLRSECESALDEGIGWLDGNFQPTENTGAGQSWLLYYLYGIERVGAFVGRDVFNGLNWYQEGGRFLLGKQKDEGKWTGEGRPEASTSFALLFLSRSSAPISGASVMRSVYGGDDPKVDLNLRAAGDTPLSVWVSSFGDKLVERYAYDGERKKGPRIARVEYLTTGGAIVADSRTGGADWRYTAKAPEAGWALPSAALGGAWQTGRGAFGPRESAQIAVATEWKAPELWLVHDFEVDPKALIEPTLELSFSAPKAKAAAPPLVKLFDEEAGFVGRLAQGGGPISFVAGGASGEHCLEVGAVQAHSRVIPGWSFKIREKPGEGEYRYLRFRWRKPSGGVMVQLAFDGGWDRAQRYHAGPNSVKFEPSLELSKSSPAKWVTVTRDLWADHGDGLLTGIGLTAMDGPAKFDGIYLARKKSDLRKEKKQVDTTPTWGQAVEAAFAGEDAAVIYLNGEPVVRVDQETMGFETVLEGEPLRAALRKGTNRIGVQVRNQGSRRAIDLGLRDHRRLATVQGRPDRPANGSRFAAQLRFPRPGRYPLWARVHVMDQATGDAVAMTSKPLQVNIEEATDTEAAAYGHHAAQNLLRQTEVEVSASSELNGWSAAQAVDGRYDLAWLCADGDPSPTIEVKLRRPAKANALLLSHTRADRKDSQRTILPRRVAVTVNGKGSPIVVDLDPSRLHKTEIPLPPRTRVRSLQIEVLDRSEPGHVTKTAVGFAELELLLRDR